MLKQSILSTLLRIMTSEEINILTKDFDGNVKVALTDIVGLDLFPAEYKTKNKSDTSSELVNETNSKDTTSQHMAKIIPIDSNTNNKKDSDKENTFSNTSQSNFFCGPEVAAILGRFKEESIELEKNIFSSQQKRSTKSVSKKSNYESTDFILNQICRTQKNNEKLRKLNVWKLYSKNSVVDIEVSKVKGTSKDLSESSTKGILVNKKQA